MRNPDHVKLMWALGSVANDKSGIYCAETIGDKITCIQRVKHIRFHFFHDFILLRSKWIISYLLLSISQTREKLQEMSKKGGKIYDKTVSEFTGRNHATMAWLYAFVNATTAENLLIIQDSCKVRSILGTCLCYRMLIFIKCCFV